MNVSISNFTGKKVIGQDPLNGVEQELVFINKGSDLRIPNLMIKDYPTILKIIR